MATETGKSFLFYFEWMDSLESLTDQDIGILIRALNAYAQNKEYEPIHGNASIAFEFMKKQIDRDKEKYRIRAEKSRINGAMGGRPKNNGSNTVVNKNVENPMGY